MTEYNSLEKKVDENLVPKYEVSNWDVAKRFTSNIVRSTGKFTGDLLSTTGAVAVMPYIIPSLVVNHNSESDESSCTTEDDSNSKCFSSGMNAGFAFGLLSWVAQPLAAIAYFGADAWWLLAGLAGTNVCSGVYELASYNLRKVKKELLLEKKLEAKNDLPNNMDL